MHDKLSTLHTFGGIMNKFKMKVLLALLICFHPVIANAAAHQWTGWYPISQVYSTYDGSFYVSLAPSSAHSNPAGCVSKSWLRVLQDQQNQQKVYQMLLTAQAAGMKVNAYVKGDGCAGNYPRILHLRTLQP